jgi:hypothetical protein
MSESTVDKVQTAKENFESKSSSIWGSNMRALALAEMT